MNSSVGVAVMTRSVTAAPLLSLLEVLLPDNVAALDYSSHEELVRWSKTLSKSSIAELADRLSIRHDLDSGLAFHASKAHLRKEKTKARKMVRSLYGHVPMIQVGIRK